MNLIILKVDVIFFWGGGLVLKGFVIFYLNNLSKILACGADDIIFILDLSLCLFVLLDLFFNFFWVLLFLGVYTV